MLGMGAGVRGSIVSIIHMSDAQGWTRIGTVFLTYDSRLALQWIVNGWC